MSMSISFRSADEAAIAALDGILKKSMEERHEFGGFIFQTGSGRQASFAFSVPLVKTSDVTGGTLTPPRIPSGAKIVATLHTHPFDEDVYDDPGVISTIQKPPRFSSIDVQGRRDFEAGMQQISSGPIDMYVIDIHGEISALEGKRGTRPERERKVRECGDLTCL